MVFQAGVPSWNKGRKCPHKTGRRHHNWKGGKPHCGICGKKLTNYNAKFCNTHRKHNWTPDQRKKIIKSRFSPVPWNKGLKGYLSGPSNAHWKGGITPINKTIRRSLEMRMWRRHVFQRDDYTCQACGQRGGKLQADHELPFALYPGLRFEVLNGRTLCNSCHRKTPTWGGHQDPFSGDIQDCKGRLIAHN